MTDTLPDATVTLQVVTDNLCDYWRIHTLTPRSLIPYTWSMEVIYTLPEVTETLQVVIDTQFDITDTKYQDNRELSHPVLGH